MKCYFVTLGEVHTHTHTHAHKYIYFALHFIHTHVSHLLKCIYIYIYWQVEFENLALSATNLLPEKENRKHR